MQQNAALAELLEFNLNELAIGSKLISKKGSNRLSLFDVLGIEIEQSEIKKCKTSVPRHIGSMEEIGE